MSINETGINPDGVTNLVSAAKNAPLNNLTKAPENLDELGKIIENLKKRSEAKPLVDSTV